MMYLLPPSYSSSPSSNFLSPPPPSLTFPFVSVSLSIHTSESQQEFFRMLDEKIEKGRDYCSEEEEEEDGT